jgi:nanoRNase/pAp phosphatase (c-di-AMP/oligoRNAs hydrolase)
MDRHTAVCDLPRHPKCGLSIDHHQSNAPTEHDDDGVVVVWRQAPSAARIAYDLLAANTDLSDLTDMLVWVDKLDGGGITREEFRSNHPVVWLGRLIDVESGLALHILEALQQGVSVSDILSDFKVAPALAERQRRQEEMDTVISESIEVVDRLAIVRLEGHGLRSNGYHVTALVGEDCDACLVVHGDVGASFGEEDRYPVSASFYTNSFLHTTGGIYDLTRLATRFDSDGGGHANACGCRIQALESGARVSRAVTNGDIEENLAVWLEMWAER